PALVYAGARSDARVGWRERYLRMVDWPRRHLSRTALLERYLRSLEWRRQRLSQAVFRERYVIRKPPAAMRRDAERTGLAKTLGAGHLVALGVGAVIGAGIFTVTGVVTAQYAGPAVAISFIVAAIVCGIAGLAYAEMASMLPMGGSAYTYAYASFGELV